MIGELVKKPLLSTALIEDCFLFTWNNMKGLISIFVAFRKTKEIKVTVTVFLFQKCSQLMLAVPKLWRHIAFLESTNKSNQMSNFYLRNLKSLKTFSLRKHKRDKNEEIQHPIRASNRFKSSVVGTKVIEYFLSRRIIFHTANDLRCSQLGTLFVE